MAELGRAYHDVPDRLSDEQLAELHYDVFTGPGGRAILDRWYWAYMMASPPEGELGQRMLGKQEMFREVLDMVQRGFALKQQGAQRHGGRNDC